MAEIEIERSREPEPTMSEYEAKTAREIRMLEAYKKGKRVVKFKDIKWENNRQGYIKFYSTPHKQDMAAPFWLLFINHIEQHSGKHIHQGGLPILVLKGKGYSIVEGVRYDWKKGDLLLLPIKPGGVEHQHFNLTNEPAEWMAIRWFPFLDFMANLTKQVEVQPNYKK